MKQKIIGVCICLLLLTTGLSIMVTALERETQEVPVVLSGNTIYVGGNGPNNYTTIQDGINHANPGDTVYVYDDSSPYYEHLIVTKTLTILGENRDTTIIDLLGHDDIDGIWVSAADVTISGFTIKNGGSGWYKATVKITANHCRFTDNKVGPSIYGMIINSSYNVLLENIISTYRQSISFTGSSFNILTNNTITTYNGTCIILDDSSNNNTFTNNTITRLKSFDSYETFELFQSSGNMFIGNNVTNGKGYCFYVSSSSDYTTISDNTISSTSAGIEVTWSTHHTITNNNFVYGGILFRYGHLQNMNTHTIENNYLNGKPIYYYKNTANLVITPDTLLRSDPAQVILVNCTNTQIQNLHFDGVFYALQLEYSTLSTISYNDFTNNNCGLYLYASSFNTISHNTFTNNYYGILQYQIDTHNNTIQKNTITQNTYGIHCCEGSKNTTVISNTITNNSGDGVFIIWSSRNTIIGNIISNNGHIGLNLVLTHDSTIYHNNIIDNAQNARDYYQSYNYVNSWDNGYPSGGNYWGNHYSYDGYQGPNQDIPGSDGIVDKPGGGRNPYNVTDGNNKDWYPLMHRFVLGDMNVDGIVSFGDINPFVLALSKPWLYMEQYKIHPVIHGDINQDGYCDFGDINPFVVLLTGGS